MCPFLGSLVCDHIHLLHTISSQCQEALSSYVEQYVKSRSWKKPGFDGKFRNVCFYSKNSGGEEELVGQGKDEICT